VALFAALVLTVRLAAQEPQEKADETQHYTVQDLGTLGGTFSVAGGINNDGLVEGFSTLTGDTDTRAFLWQQGDDDRRSASGEEKRTGMIDLGTLGGSNSDAASRPSERGEVGGESETSITDPTLEDFCGYGTNLICLPFLWRDGVMTPLPTLGGNNGSGYGINDRGEVVGTAENTNTTDPTCSPYPQIKPVIWRKGQVHELPTFPGDPDGVAFAINDRGEAVGVSGDCNHVLHALLWRNGKAIDLGSLGGTRNHYAVDINNRGQVVGHSNLLGDKIFHAFLWQKGVLTDLGTLSGDVRSTGNGINSKGQVAGGSFDSSGNGRAFLWQDGVMTDLNTLIPPDSPLYLIEASGTINDRGQIARHCLADQHGPRRMPSLRLPQVGTGPSAKGRRSFYRRMFASWFSSDKASALELNG